jgi:topoisomerase-4 subunit B
MYTDTSRPNHLAQEVIDNAVDEALAGHANKICVTVYKDGSLSVEDNGRGMPVDIHPEYGQSGIEIILTKLHAGGNSVPITISFQVVCMVWDFGECFINTG